MSNFDALPTVESDAGARIHIAEQVRHAGIITVCLSGLSVAAEASIRAYYNLPFIVDAPVKDTLIAASVGAGTALGAAAYEFAVRQVNGLHHVDIPDGLSLLTSRER